MYFEVLNDYVYRENVSKKPLEINIFLNQVNFCKMVSPEIVIWIHFLRFFGMHNHHWLDVNLSRDTLVKTMSLVLQNQLELWSVNFLEVWLF